VGRQGRVKTKKIRLLRRVDDEPKKTNMMGPGKVEPLSKKLMVMKAYGVDGHGTNELGVGIDERGETRGSCWMMDERDESADMDGRGVRAGDDEHDMATADYFVFCHHCLSHVILVLLALCRMRYDIVALCIPLRLPQQSDSNSCTHHTRGCSNGE